MITTALTLPAALSSLTLAATNPVDHVVGHPFIVENGWWLWSANMTNLVLAGLILLVLGPWVARRIAVKPELQGADRYITRNPFAHMIEVMIVGIRDGIVAPLLGDRTERFMPLLLTLFFFILVNNLLGLIPLLDVALLLNKFAGGDWKATHSSPIGGTATQNIYVTAGLALIAFLVVNAAGVRELGVGGYLKHLTAGTPVFLWPIMIPVELMGTLIKPVALALRLFANMTAGHILLATMFMFVELGFNAGALIAAPVGLLSTVGALAIYGLELFVAFLQAFIFMFLTTVFIAQLSHHDHDHDHDGAHDGHHHDHHEALPQAMSPAA